MFFSSSPLPLYLCKVKDAQCRVCYPCKFLASGKFLFLAHETVVSTPPAACSTFGGYRAEMHKRCGISMYEVLCTNLSEVVFF